VTPRRRKTTRPRRHGVVTVRNHQRRVRVSVARVGAIATRALAAVGRPGVDVHISLVGDPTIRRLNGRYLGVRRATDVLAFNLESPGPSPLWGEVIVSVDTAARQAGRLGVSVALEVDLLVTHGLLHLAGYDDHDPRQARRMHERARKILGARSRNGGGPAVPERLWTGLLDRS